MAHNEDTCMKCNHVMQIGEFPFCPHDHQANSVIGDDIPGGIWIEHGLCNADGSPRRYDTKSAMARDAKKAGLHQGAFLTGSPHGRTWF